MKRVCGMLVALVCLAAVVSVTAEAQQFTDATASVGNIGVSGTSAAWGDYDNDGDQDVYVIVSGGNKLFKNNGSGSFTEVLSSPVNFSGGLFARWVDVENDGDLDLVVIGQDNNRLFLNNGGSFTDATRSSGIGISPDHASVAAWSDYNGDGYPDVYIANARGIPILYRNNGNGTFTNATAAAGLDSYSYSSSAAWADYDNDGDQDVYIADGTSANSLYRNNGNGSFSRAESSLSENFQDIAWIDYDNDGDLDLFLLKERGGSRLLRNNGQGGLSDVSVLAGLASAAGSSVSWMDYDNDGFIDAIVASETGGKVFHNTGSGVFTDTTVSVGSGVTSGSRIVSVDYDNNGTPDMFVFGPSVKLFKNNGNTNRWLELKPIGITSNKNAIGARIKIIAGSRAQIRESNGGPVLFGLGTSVTADSVIVRWPSGTVQVLTNVAANQILSVTETSPAIVSLSSSSVDFGSIATGQTSVRTVAVRNTGGTTLIISGASTGNSEFAVSPTIPPGININPGDSTMITVNFVPVSAGGKSATLTVSHNASGGISTVSLSGSATSGVPPSTPSFVVAPTTLAMDSTNVGSSSQKVLVVSNAGTASLIVSSAAVSGTDAGVFNVSPTAATISTGANQIFTITFAPATVGSKSASLTFTHNASGSPNTVALSGVGKSTGSPPPTPTPIIAVSPTAIAIDTAHIGSFSQRTFTVSNTGTANLVISNIARSGADSIMFSVSPTAFTVSPGGTQTVTVSFAPVSTGSKATILGIYHNAIGFPSPYQTVVSGVGKNGTVTVAPVISFPASLTLDSASVGSSSQSAAVVSNTGTASLAVTSITVFGVDANMFSVSPTNAAVAAGGSQTVTVRFVPTSVGAKSAALLITHNASGSPDTIGIAGVGKSPPPVPLFSVSPTTLVTDSVFAGSTSQKTFTVSNLGALALNVSAVTVSGTDASQFSVLPTSASVGVGESRIFIATFAPTSSGTKSASLKLTHNAAGSPDSVMVSGVGRTSPSVPQFSVSPAALTMDTTNVGVTSQKVLNVINTGATTLNISSVATSGTNAARFSVIPSSAIISAGGNQFFIVTFAPDSAGSKSASLIFTHNASGSPNTVVLSGVGKSTGSPPPATNPVITVTSTSLTMDTTLVGSFSQKTFTVSNTGTANLVVSSITRSGADSTQFAVSPAAFTVSAGGSQVVTVTFAPIIIGLKSAVFTVNHNASGSGSTVVGVSGTGKPAPAVQPPPTQPPKQSVPDSLLVVDFRAVRTEGPIPLVTKFLMTFSSEPLRKIKFMPGNGDTLLNDPYPQVVYRTAGRYTVKLEAIFEDGRIRTVEKKDYITAVENPPVVDFTVAPTSGWMPLTVLVSVKNTGGPVTGYTVDFGDSVVVNTARDTVSHIYTKIGAFTVRVTANGPGGSNSKSGIISVTERPVRSADFNADGKVDFDDFFLFAAAFGQKATDGNEKFDLSYNGQVDVADFFVFSEAFGQPLPLPK